MNGNNISNNHNDFTSKKGNEENNIYNNFIIDKINKDNNTQLIKKDLNSSI